MSRIHSVLRNLWDYLLEVSGENDYAHHCERARKLGRQPMTRQAFYLHQEEHKHSRPTRCC